jgi:hypothetical protein
MYLFFSASEYILSIFSHGFIAQFYIESLKIQLEFCSDVHNIWFILGESLLFICMLSCHVSNLKFPLHSRRICCSVYFVYYKRSLCCIITWCLLFAQYISILLTCCSCIYGMYILYVLPPH